MITKQCSKCKSILYLEKFSKRKISKDGYRNQCKECCKVTSKTPEGRARINAYRRDKYANDTEYLEKDKARSKKYRELNSLQIKKQQAQYYEANKDALRESNKLRSREHYVDNMAKYKKNHIKWRKENIDKVRKYAAAYRARKLNATPPWFSEFDELVIDEAFALAKGQTGRLGVKFEVDHIVPLQGKLVSGLHCGLNIQVITQSENRRKSNTFNI